MRETDATEGEVLPGLVVPGLANAHSHAFHRVLRARTEAGVATFWAWRDVMYEVAERLDPDTYFRLARAVYAEMALAGVAAVGEFHYLHHDRGGAEYPDPNEMGKALVEAAREAGIRITLLDACYLNGGFGEELRGPQLRFGDRDPEAWAERVERLREDLAADGPGPGVLVGAAIHSVRAVPAAAMPAVVAWAQARGAPLHFHVSEQPAENEACLRATGHTPVGLLDDCGALGPRSTAVHATRVGEPEIARLGSTGTAVCLCPTTERALADGIGPAAALVGAGSPLAVGSDSHAVIDLFEEARAIELDERLSTNQRGRHRAPDLLGAATRNGMRSLGWEGGALAEGLECDLVALDLDSPRMAGYRDQDAAAWVVFAATAAEVTHVVVSGRTIVCERRHVLLGDVGAELGAAIAQVVP